MGKTVNYQTQPSVNVWKKWHWAQFNAHAKKVDEAVRLTLLAAKWKGPPIERAKVDFVYYFPSAGANDKDNRASKFVQDSLVTCGVLMADDFAHCESNVVYGGVDHKNPRIEVVVEEVS